MRLRDTLDDHKRYRDHPTRFPGERRTTAGLFSGATGRLVHVAPDGGLRDFGYPLSGRSCVSDSRFGLLLADPPGAVDWDAYDVRETDDGLVVPFEEGDQTYHGDTTLVESRFETPIGIVDRYDLTVETDAGAVHVLRVEPADTERAADAAASLLAGVTFAPEGQDARVGQLRHDNAVEVFHDREHDFVAGAPWLHVRGGGLPEPPESVLEGEPETPGAPLDDRREGDRLGGRVVAASSLDDGGATLATLATDRTDTTRETALSTLSEVCASFDSPAAFRESAETVTPTDSTSPLDLPEGTPMREVAVDDLRVLSLLSAPTGLRIAGPDFDPHYVHSGGYGYTWFRDDAEISGFLLSADATLDLGLDDWHRRSVRAYIDTQRPDGTWPHRVWPRDGALAPGWANARLEADGDLEYQADQTASVVAFLARARRTLPADDPLVPDVEAALSAGVEGMCDSLADDGRPVACQNAWEDAGGRFTHTAARFLDAFVAVAALDGEEGVASTDDGHVGAEEVDIAPGGLVRAAEARHLADELYTALDDLWCDERGVYAVGEFIGGGLDTRLDSATFALADAHRAYDAVAGVDEQRRDRLVSHVETTIDGLYRDPSESLVAGLARYEGDGWRRRSQSDEKIWTVSTAWGANAAAEVSALLADAGDERAGRFAERSRDLLRLVGPDGPLTVEGGYLPEQFFDSGAPDSATPLGWPHAIRLATTALLDDHGELSALDEPATTADGPVVTDD